MLNLNVIKIKISVSRFFSIDPSDVKSKLLMGVKSTPPESIENNMPISHSGDHNLK